MLRSSLGIQSRIRALSYHHATKAVVSHDDPQRRAVTIAASQQHFSHSRARRFVQKLRFSSYTFPPLTTDAVWDYCAENKIGKTRDAGAHVTVEECPFCHETNGRADNQHKLFIKKDDGAYFCHRCGASGSWSEFRENFGGDGGAKMNARHNDSPHRLGRRNTTTPGPIRGLPLPENLVLGLYGSSLVDTKNESLEYLTNVRGLKTSTLRKYGVGRHFFDFPDRNSGKYVSMECITFPWILPVGEVVEQEKERGAVVTFPEDQDTVVRRIKVRALDDKGHQRLVPSGGGWGMFGYHTIPEDATEVVITEGEFDAMAVYQATGVPAVSLPNGANSLPAEILPLMKRFKKIYLWMDTDEAGQSALEKNSDLFGIARCHLVKPSCDPVPKDANEALLGGLDLKQMLKEAALKEHKYVLPFSSLRDQVIEEILNPDKYIGVPTPSLPGLTDIIRGFRRGELTVITGPTGSGKTTLLSQLSIDFAEQGISTLWGSFEIKNTRLIKKMMQQFIRRPLPSSNIPEAREKLKHISDDFQLLPIHYLAFHGSSDIDQVIESMQYAYEAHNAEHIILDNMQFMISRRGKKSSFDKFETQDMAIEKFREFATNNNVHVTLVCHPRKEEEGAKLGMNSFYGSAKATQEADLVLIVQKNGNRKFVEVVKNRFDGNLGYCPLHFERDSGRYLHMPPAGSPDVGSGKTEARNSQLIPKIPNNKWKQKPEVDGADENVDDHFDQMFDAGNS